MHQRRITEGEPSACISSAGATSPDADRLSACHHRRPGEHFPPWWRRAQLQHLWSRHADRL